MATTVIAVILTALVVMGAMVGVGFILLASLLEGFYK